MSRFSAYLMILQRNQLLHPLCYQSFLQDPYFKLLRILKQISALTKVLTSKNKKYRPQQNAGNPSMGGGWGKLNVFLCD
jgi:hypothetical protein